ncbi:MAG: hypothetical protein Q7U76_14430 [Nitrospirota bacterium]|nr:hypothetical protein [Nitrospirota bacterium]
MQSYRLCLLVLVGCFVASGGLSAQEQPSAPRILLEQPAYFTAPDGASLTIPPGSYAVEGANESALRLLEQGGAPALIVGAASIHHEEPLSDLTAALILTDEDTLHLVLLHPDGTALEAVGSLTGVQSRAPISAGPGNSPTPLAQGQVQQGLQAFGEIARVAGTPPAPLLTAPLAGHSIAAWGESVSWQPGTGTLAPISYQLCISEAGRACARPGQASTTSVVIPNLPPTMRTYRITGPMLQPLLAYGQQKNLIWTVGACVPSPIISTSGGRLAGGSAPLTCTYARPRSLTWKLVLNAPVLNPPQWPLVNDRPQLNIQGPVEGAHHYLFCLVDRSHLQPNTRAICADGSRESTIHQAGASVEGDNRVIVNTGTSLSTSGWEWKYEASPLPARPVRVPVVGISVGYETGAFEGSVGACLDAQHPCSWSAPIHVDMLPLIDRATIQPIQESPSRYRLEWRGAISNAVTHYRVCLATAGSSFPLVYINFTYRLVNFPGMLRDLCSDSGEIPPGQQPVYQRELPPEMASFCPPGGCRMPQPVATYVAGAGLPRYILDLKDHPELASFHGQSLALAVAACSGSSRNCLWDLAHSEIHIPAVSREPSPVILGVSLSTFSLRWQAWSGNAYYIPCVREANATCETGNLLRQPRMDTPRVGSLQDHPHACSLSGPSLSGIKTVQVAGCNDAWGCRWSPPQQQSFSAIRLPLSQSALTCR